MASLNNLDAALHYFASTYFAGIECEWDDACDKAEAEAKSLRYPAPSVCLSDDDVAAHLRAAAARYADI